MAGVSDWVPVPRGTNPSSSSSSGFTYQSPSYSSRVNDWLLEDRKTMPWNIIDSVLAPTSDQSDTAHDTAVSEAAATQGSSKGPRQ